MLQTHLTIEVFSHHFKVSRLTPRGRDFCFEFSKRFWAWGFKQERGRGVRFIAKVFAAANIRRTYFRFHINVLEDFKKAMEEAYLTDNLVTWTEAPKHTPVAVKFNVKSIWKAREDQMPFIDYLSNKDPASKLVSLQTGKGKSLRASTLIRTPGGWKRNGDIEVGDTVIAYDGSETKVMGVYPQGKLQLYRVTFADGRTCDCSADHLWWVYYINTSPDKRWRVVDTTEMMRLLAMPNPRVYIPLITPDESPDVSLPTDPYTLGAMGLEGFEKEIPSIYLEASPSQRLALLQGLLDTDGAVQKNGSVSYCSPGLELAEGVQHLVRSLGGIAALRSKPTQYAHNAGAENDQVLHEVDIRFKKPSSLFRLPGKKDRTNDDIQYAKDLKLRVTNIVPIDIDEAVCISIDHPSKLYVAEGFIATHNTFCALQAVANLGLRTAIIVKSMYIEKWVADVQKTFDIAPERVLVIQGSKSLMAALALAKEGLLDCDVLIFSITTVGQWFDAYEEQGDGLLDQGYDCTPENWLNFLGVGCKLVDEVHQFFHAMFKMDLYTHVQQSIALSATLINKDPFLEKMYEVMFPAKDRPANMALHRYAHAYALHYNFLKPDHIRTTEHGSNTYSHAAVEKSIMRHVPTLQNYVRMIDYAMKISYFDNKKAKKRLAVFAASIDMCTHLTEYFQRKYPDLDIRRYVGEDPYENAIEADIRFTTVGSMGTAIDVPDLTTVILTNAMASVQANVQVLGRLREITGEKVEFIFFTADNIPKHVAYYDEKKHLMRERAASFGEVYNGFSI